jgi:hypothetical protein
MRVAVLDEASIVCSTLSFAGSAMFYRMTRKFDVVVIDEVGWLVCVRVCVWGGHALNRPLNKLDVGWSVPNEDPGGDMHRSGALIKSPVSHR